MKPSPVICARIMRCVTTSRFSVCVAILIRNLVIFSRFRKCIFA